MAITVTPATYYEYYKQQGRIDLITDDIKAALMNDSFAFDRDNHATWSDVSGEELSISGEYAQVSLISGEVFADETANSSYVTYNDIVFIASGESFDPTIGCIIYDNTDAAKPIIAGIEFGTSYTVTAGNNMTLKNPKIEGIAQQTTV